MRSQAAERERWLAQLHAATHAPPTGVALVAVAQGTGNREILRSEGAKIVIEGGQTMNPSVGQILEAVTAVNADHVIVLPNNPNVRLAAENAARESTKDVRVIETGSVPEGIAAAFEFDAAKDVDANEAAMRETLASRPRGRDHDRLAGRDGRRRHRERGRLPRAARREGRRGRERPLGRPGRSCSIVSRPTGARTSTRCSARGPPTADEIKAHVEARGLDADVSWGGQPHYPLLLSAE